MDKLFKKIHNITTGEVEELELTAEEVAEHVARQQKAKADRDARLAAEAKAEEDKAALLVKLGITAEEAKLLLS